MFNGYSEFLIIHGDLIIARGERASEAIAALAQAPCPTTIRIEKRGENETQYAIVCHQFWKEKEVQIPNSWSKEFTRSEILFDIAKKVCRMHGYTMMKAHKVV